MMDGDVLDAYVYFLVYRSISSIRTEIAYLAEQSREKNVVVVVSLPIKQTES